MESVSWADTKKPVLSKDGAWVPRGTTFVAAECWFGGHLIDAW